MKVVDERNGTYKRLIQSVLIYPSLEQDELIGFGAGHISVYVEHDYTKTSMLDHLEEPMVQWNINLRDMTIERFDEFMKVLKYARSLASLELLTNPEIPLPEVEDGEN